MTIIQEIERRAALSKVVDAAIIKNFRFYRNDTTRRIRRDLVHTIVYRELGLNDFGNWRTKRIIGERLGKMGAKKLLSTGKRYFTGLEVK